MNETVNSNRGCFDRHDDVESKNEYASSPCFMHELDPAYFGLAPTTASDRKLHDPGLFFNALLITRTLRKKIVKARWRLPNEHCGPASILQKNIQHLKRWSFRSRIEKR